MPLQRPEEPGKLLPGPVRLAAAHKEDFHHGGVNEAGVPLCRRLGGDFPGLFHPAVLGDGQGAALVHQGAALVDGVGPLVVDVRQDGVDEVLLLQAEVLLRKGSLGDVGGQENLPQQPGAPGGDAFPFQGEAVVDAHNGAGEKLVPPGLAHIGAERGPVQLAEGLFQLCEVGAVFAPPAQQVGQDGVDGDGLLLQRGQQVDADAVMLELPVPNAGEVHAFPQPHPVQLLAHCLAPYSI